MLPPTCDEEKLVRCAVERETRDSLSSERVFAVGRLA